MLLSLVVFYLSPKPCVTQNHRHWSLRDTYGPGLSYFTCAHDMLCRKAELHIYLAVVFFFPPNDSSLTRHSES